MKQSSIPWDPFDTLSAEQYEKLDAYEDLLLRFNRQINLISRKDEAHVGRHIRHVLTLARRGFPAGSRIMDWGTGGGLPAIPLAICFPDVEVHAADSAEKKIRAVRVMGRRLGLANLHAWHGRAEKWPGRASYSVSRATAPLVKLWRWHTRICVSPEDPPNEGTWMPGLLCLKGGNLREEVARLEQTFPDVDIERRALEPLLNESFFADKYLVEVHGSCQ